MSRVAGLLTQILSLLGNLLRERFAARQLLDLLVDHVGYGLLNRLLHPERDLRRGERSPDIHGHVLQHTAARNGHLGLVVDRLVEPRRTRKVDVYVADLQIEGRSVHPAVADLEADLHILGLDLAQFIVAQRIGHRLESLDVLDIDILRADLARGVERSEVGRHSRIKSRGQIERQRIVAARLLEDRH